MNAKTIAISFYLVFLYWISMHFPALKTVFYPTLGAFCYLFVSRTFHIKELSKITLGAVVASLLGCVLHALYPSAVTFFLNTLLVIWLIRRFQWNAPPILAVSLVPFFISPMVWWVVPISVLASLSGLLLVVGGFQYAGAFRRPLLATWRPESIRSVDRSSEM